jgi:CRP-like cAMP-binding protein
MNILMMKVESLFNFFMRITVLVSSAILDGIYPNTEATEDSELLCISKHNFLKLITENATISIKIIQILSQCLHYKSGYGGRDFDSRF